MLPTDQVDSCWPPLRSAQRGAGAVPVPSRVALECADEWSDHALDRFSYLNVRPASGAEELTVRVVRDPALGPEQFRLDIRPDRVEVVAAAPGGVGHAATTVRQLLPADAWRRTPVERGSWVLPVVAVDETPAHPWRGFMLDVARHFVPKQDVLRLVEHLAMHRLNRLHLHLTDDQGWRVQSTRYPRLAEVASWRAETVIGVPGVSEPARFDGTPHGGFYSVADLREITAHAARHGIEVVPEIDLPSHADALIAALPELGVPGTAPRRVNTTWGVVGSLINPLPAARAVVAELLAEVADAVDSPYLHVGGDEAPLDEWAGSAAVRAYVEESGLASIEELQSQVYRFLGRTVEELGRRPVMWDEGFHVPGIPPSTIIMAWRAQSHGVEAMRAGHDVVMAPVDGTYFDYNESGDDEPLALGAGQDIEHVAAFGPSVPADLPGALLGVQAQLWTEYTPDTRTVAYRTFPRLAVHAANAWTGEPTPWPGRRDALTTHLARLAAAGIEYRPLEGPHPWQRGGTGRRKAISPLRVNE
ncbi:beta-N-acetylhexosaminidase [Actinomycetes bacterium KLBMP 9759]